MAVYVVRHGQSEINLVSYFSCRIDSPLTQAGKNQARTLGKWFARRGQRFDAAYSSPLLRAKETAEILLEEVGGSAPRIDERIQEYDGGDLTGVSGRDLKTRFPEVLDRPRAEWGDLSPWGGESYQRVAERVTSFLTQLANRHDPNEELLIVSHGGIMFHILQHWCCEPAPRSFMAHLTNCHVLAFGVRHHGSGATGELRYSLPIDLIESL